MKRTLGVLACVVLSFSCGSNPLLKPATIIAVASEGNNATSLIGGA